MIRWSELAFAGCGGRKGVSQVYFDIKKSSKTGEYWFVAKAGNHGTILISELYKSKQSAKKAIRVIKDGAAGVIVYDDTGEVSGSSIDDLKVSV